MSESKRNPRFRGWSAAFAACVMVGGAGAVEVPNPALTPGEALPVTSVDICSPGYRPTGEMPYAEEMLEIYKSYGMDYFHDGYCNNPDGCQLDHLISLALGGANSRSNLWPQPVIGQWTAAKKDLLEQRLLDMVCKGSMTVTEAQLALTSDWRQAYTRYVSPTLPTPYADPRRHNMGGVDLLTGGVGTSVRDAMEEEASGYNLRIGFALANGGNFVSGVQVRISDAGGRQVADTTATGPWLFARLTPGRYLVEAEYAGQTQSYSADLSRPQSQIHYLYWQR